MRRAFIVMAAAWAAMASGQQHQGVLQHYEASRMSMACLYTIDAYGADPHVPEILKAALDEVDRIDRLMSHYKPESPLSQINRDAAQGEVMVDHELFDVIKESLRYSRDSQGAFDITVGPLMKAWGFFRGEGRLPDDRELLSARTHVGSEHVTLNMDTHTIRFDAAGVELDLGGIAKGYAVDRAAGILETRHVDAALLSAGGSTIYGLGAPPGLQAWNVSIQDPMDARKTARVVKLKDRALSVAGSSEKFFEADGIRYSHIMDPRTGRPVQGMLTVAVLSKTGIQGDALDDALFVLGTEKSRAYLERLTDVTALFFTPAPGHGWTMTQEGQ
jgi:thiamine biosynthesis lipoprotein